MGRFRVRFEFYHRDAIGIHRFEYESDYIRDVIVAQDVITKEHLELDRYAVSSFVELDHPTIGWMAVDDDDSDDNLDGQAYLAQG